MQNFELESLTGGSEHPQKVKAPPLVSNDSSKDCVNLRSSTAFSLLNTCLNLTPQADYPFHSRIHPLRSFCFPSAACFVKRDDELGFGISGSKIRKYRSLIPFLLANTIEEVVLIGSLYSNHVLSLTQLLIENRIKPTLFLRGDPSRQVQGNALLTTLFIPPSSIHWFSKSNWKEVEETACAWAKEKKIQTLVLPEGGFHFAALPGALTLPLDVVDNEKKLGIQFNHIFIEAGTGFTAMALILGLHLLKHQATVHVILLADDKEAFQERLKSCHRMFCQLIGESCCLPNHFILHLPKLTKGFGQVSPSLFEQIGHLAREEGFLTDPIYSAKLFIESQGVIRHRQLSGNILIHHSGGALTLMGFQEQLHQSLRIHSN